MAEIFEESLKRVSRQMDILITLRREESTSVRQLADKYGVAPRTIMYDLDELQEFHANIERDRGTHATVYLTNIDKNQSRYTLYLSEELLVELAAVYYALDEKEHRHQKEFMAYIIKKITG